MIEMTTKMPVFKEKLTRREFRRFYADPKIPVVLTNNLSHVSTSHILNFNWFKDNYNDLDVKVSMGTVGRRLTLVDTTMGKYIDEVVQGATVEKCGYLAQVSVENFADLAKETLFPEYCWLKQLACTEVWIGPAKTKTILHCDFGDTLVLQAVGRKRFLLYSPSTTSRIPLGRKTYGSWTSGLNLESPPPPDPDFDFVLESGQTLYIPPHYWHEVTSLEASISVTQFCWTPTTFITRGSLEFLSLQTNQLLQTLHNRFAN